jgi:hypothetical protein
MIGCRTTKSILTFANSIQENTKVQFQLRAFCNLAVGELPRTPAPVPRWARLAVLKRLDLSPQFRAKLGALGASGGVYQLVLPALAAWGLVGCRC